ncbi:chitobiosyldiphosphodolichol beta-mannosyltransferase-like [Mya arenaria]|uniref:chitobiosyldiphosphodolichol beta-mannosyltransferase-like n=1 Tax=Mya arenaria TaxID=6604 RepID=UPI0022DF5B2D|nr:chitobiosyldiphosphodolichol beta-mannosyltransferase-like [Mya arenaria]
MLIVGTIFMALPPVVFLLYVCFNYYVAGRRSVCIVVLGDIGRSPRMQYHAISFLKSGFTVDMVGYSGSEVQAELKNNDNMTLHYMKELPSCLKGCPRLVSYMVKVVWQCVTMAAALLLMPKCGHILVQNPPCIPTFLVAVVTCWLRGARLVIDWHNYGYTIMGLSLGYTQPIVRLAKWYERLFGRFSSENICVTRAMQEDLQTNWGIRSSVMYDRPPEMFHTTPLNDRHQLFVCLSQQYPAFRPLSGEISNDETAFTVANGNGDSGSDSYYIQTRPALLVSSTSWTEDEDFGVLLSALEDYEATLSDGQSPDLPKLVCVITGKGPLKEFYREAIESRSWKHIAFCLPWLTPEDYPLLLGSADLGICLHKSSSGLDLPMKVVDMFGCGLPVCAIHFNCLNELVQHNENGLVFKDSSDLSKCFKDLLHGFPNHCKQLDKFRENLATFKSSRWHENWSRTVLPLFDDTVTHKRD